MADAKYIHISDILSFYSGKMLAAHEAMTAPDGSQRLAWDGGLTPILAVAEQLDGRTFWLDKPKGSYDGDRLGMRLPELREALVAQLPWLKNYPKAGIPKVPEGASEADVKKFLGDFVAGVAASQGGEWFKVSEAPKSATSNLDVAVGTLRM